MRHRKSTLIALAATLLAAGARTGWAVDGRGPLIDPQTGNQIGTVFGVGYAPTGDTWDFDADHIQAALSMSTSANDVIQINAGTYIASNLAISSPAQIVVDGNVTIQASSPLHSSVFICSATAANGGSLGAARVGTTGRLTLLPAAGANDQHGFLVLKVNNVLPSITVRITNTTFTGFHTNADGGAIFGTSGLVEACAFENCTAVGNGGAIFGGLTANGLTTDIDSCNFTNCHADGNGGAVSTVRSISHGTASGCNAGVSGGGYHNVVARIGDATATSPTTTITGCSAPEGGGISFCDGEVVACLVAGNTATGVGGGGIAEVDGPISRCVIRDNQATNSTGNNGRGGGLYKCCVSLISNCNVLANIAQGQGGGMFDCDADILHVNFVRNRSVDEGGAARNCDGLIFNCIFVGNMKGSAASNVPSMLSNSSGAHSCFVHSNYSGGGNNQSNGTNTAGFVNFIPANAASTWDLHLTNGSICIANGNANHTTADNIDNGHRPLPAGTAPDIGSAEINQN